MPDRPPGSTHDRWLTLDCLCALCDEFPPDLYDPCDCGGGVTVYVPKTATIMFGGLLDNCRWPTNMQALFDGDVTWSGPRQRNIFYSLPKVADDDPNITLREGGLCTALYALGTLSENEVLDLHGLSNACDPTLDATVEGPRYAYIGQTTTTSALGTTTIDAYLSLFLTVSFCEDPALGKGWKLYGNAVYVMSGDSDGTRAYRVQMEVNGAASPVGALIAPTCVAFAGGGELPNRLLLTGDPALGDGIIGNSETFTYQSCGCLPLLVDCGDPTYDWTLLIGV